MPWHEPLTAETNEGRVLRQLCEAILFEGLGSPIGETTDRNWTCGAAQFRARMEIGSFDRPRIYPGSIMTKATDTWRPATLDDVVDALQAKDALKTELNDDLRRTAYLTDLTRATVAQRGPRITMTYDALETAIDEGHPYHPCFKARSGFSDADHLAFGPEAAAAFQLHWYAVDRQLVDQAAPDSFCKAALCSPTRLKLCDRAITAGIDLSLNALFPIHPWQAEKLKGEPLYQTWFEIGKITPLGAFGDKYRATQSVRTLSNANNPNRAHVKTAMAMRNTSSLRTIEPHSVCVASAISDWLAAVLDTDPLFSTECRLTILHEYAGAIVGRDTPLAGHLAVLYRESPQMRGFAADQVMPLNALSLIEASRLPLIDPWVQKHGLHAWLDQLLQVVVLPVWHLMVAHGIALEAHGQNLMLEHDDGWPTGLIARDFHESVEYMPALLSQPDLVPDFVAIDPAYADADPDQFHQMQSAEALRELVMDTLFIYNLAELSHLLHKHYAMPENLFWQRVRCFLDQHVTDHDLQARQALFDPFAPQIFTESLMTLKLNGGKGVFRHAVTNPLNLTKG
ncbi:MAG: IucA/IucC family protein [Litoreibacter sp.]|uniref:IucA/IucC family protein n=1 Tax=Litoreibacter sp. TaxID=1969459 RepID=UPI003297168A